MVSRIPYRRLTLATTDLSYSAVNLKRSLVPRVSIPKNDDAALHKLLSVLIALDGKAQIFPFLIPLRNQDRGLIPQVGFKAMTSAGRISGFATLRGQGFSDRETKCRVAEHLSRARASRKYAL